MRKHWLNTFYALLLILVTGTSQLYAQQLELEQVPGPITSEAFDLHVDKNGLLWVAHNGGISSYDGRNYRHYTNPAQISPAMSGLCEDPKGRIWCYNFNGQVWYVENGQLKLLRDYEYEKEPYFPRMGIWRNELIISSKRGLFSYNTVTGKSRYVDIDGGSYCIAISENYVLVLGGGWYLYKGLDSPVIKITEAKKDILPGPRILHNESYKNSFWVFQNPESLVYELKIKNDSLFEVNRTHLKSFINSISTSRKNAWFHGKMYSTNVVNKNLNFSGYNLSDIIYDKYGNVWASSLRYGLMKMKTNNNVLLDRLLNLSKNEHITAIISTHDKKIIVAGTSSGEIILIDNSSSKVIRRFNIKLNGSIENLFLGLNSDIYIGASVGLFKFNLDSYKLTTVFNDHTVKNIFWGNNILAISTSSNLFLTSTKEIKSREELDLINKKFPTLGLKTRMKDFLEVPFFRGNAACLLEDSILFFSNKNGLFKATSKSVELVLYNNKRIYAKNLIVDKDRLFVSSSTQGLFVWKKDGIHKINLSNFIQSENLLNMKRYGDELFLFSISGIFKYNLKNGSVSPLMLNNLKSTDVINLEKVDSTFYIITRNGSYLLKEGSGGLMGLPGLNILYCIINTSDTIVNNNFTLSYNQNYLDFHFTFPWFGSSDNLVIYYKLSDINSFESTDKWTLLNSNVDNISLPALEPGQYRLMMKVKNMNTGAQSNPITREFTINPPWWKTPLFLFSALVAFSLLLFLFVKNWFRQKLAAQQQAFEKQLAVEQERNRISKEMHDDIGAGLSGIKLMTELTKSETTDPATAGELEKLTLSLSDIASRMKEVIWSLSTENDSLASLFSFIEKQVKLQVENYPCTLKVSTEENVPEAEVKGELRRNIYLTVKEAVNNIVKHSGADHIMIHLGYRNNTIKIRISDNGVGFDTRKQDHDGNGIANMRHRVEEAGGTFLLSSSANGTTLELQIPINPNI